MPLELKWVNDDARDDVATVRLQSYADDASAAEQYRQTVRSDDRARSGDYLVAYHDGAPVGTATSLSMRMWMRGVVIPCQGVAWVGTIRTHRRGSHRFGGKGIASQVMDEVLRIGRERGDVVSALHPFRASFYEHFGYGVVERRIEWTLPVHVLPAGSTDGLRFYQPADNDAVHACLYTVTTRGQCGVERSPGRWAKTLSNWQNGWTIVDRPKTDGPIRGYLHFTTRQTPTGAIAVVDEQVYENTPALIRQLRFLASLRDQYDTVICTLPADIPLNLVLRESQIGEDSVNHPTAIKREYNRMQLRVLDHKRLLESFTWPDWAKGSSVFCIQESEGRMSRFSVDVSEGRATVTTTTATPHTAISDNTWAQIVTGDLTASRALNMGLIAVDNKTCLQLLDALTKGPSPFCHEHF